MAEVNENQNQLNIELNEEVAEGIYANLAIITHSHSEFVVDFIRVMPNVPKAKVQSRIIMTPQHAKRLMNALRENIGKFEYDSSTVNHWSVIMVKSMSGYEIIQIIL
jgi:ribonuclease BN (tRNA processing enzyme)